MDRGSQTEVGLVMQKRGLPQFQEALRRGGQRAVCPASHWRRAADRSSLGVRNMKETRRRSEGKGRLGSAAINRRNGTDSGWMGRKEVGRGWEGYTVAWEVLWQAGAVCKQGQGQGQGQGAGVNTCGTRGRSMRQSRLPQPRKSPVLTAGRS